MRDQPDFSSIKICLWPVIKRFKILLEGDKFSQNDLWGKKSTGQKVFLADHCPHLVWANNTAIISVNIRSSVKCFYTERKRCPWRNVWLNENMYISVTLSTDRRCLLGGSWMTEREWTPPVIVRKFSYGANDTKNHLSYLESSINVFHMSCI